MIFPDYFIQHVLASAAIGALFPGLPLYVYFRFWPERDRLLEYHEWLERGGR